jgi:hypothetical protein
MLARQSAPVSVAEQLCGYIATKIRWGQEDTRKIHNNLNTCVSGKHISPNTLSSYSDKHFFVYFLEIFN